MVGRDAELRLVEAVVCGGAERGAIVLVGEAGIGKSVLWEAAVDQGRARGLVVLASRAVEAERTLDGVVLADLLDPVVDDVLSELSTPRRRALAWLLLREDVGGDRVDRRALSVAVLDALQLLATDRSLLLAVDDAQWVDPLSAGVLAFALRRVLADVRVVLAQRPIDAAATALEDALSPARVRRVQVQPLTLGALHLVLRDRTGRVFPRQTLVRIHHASAGNPFFALELARALRAEADPLAPLPVPDTLDGLLRARLAGLPDATREALALTSALGTASEALLERAGIAPEAFERALSARVVEREQDTVRFSHPLLASVVYRDLDASQRRRIHRRIAEVVADPLLRARHRALAEERPSPDVAAMLDDAAIVALARGAAAAAAELREHAIRLTPPQACEERHRRVLEAARAHQAAGEWPRARRLASDLLDAASAGRWRAEALVVLSELEPLNRAAELLEEALAEAELRPELQTLIHCRLAWATRFRGGLHHARAAVALADRLGDEQLRGYANAVHAIRGWFAGTAAAPSDLALLTRQLARALGGERMVQEATLAIVNTYAPSPRRDEARAMLQREHAEWRDRDEPRAARALWGLAWLEFWAGNWDAAAEHADRAYDIAVQYGIEVPQDHLPVAVIAAHRGQFERARVHSELALDLAEVQFGLHPPQHLAVLGLVEAASGDRARALERLEKADEQAAAFEWREPSVRWWTPDEVELLLEEGRVDRARRLLEVWEADAVSVERPWVLAHATRCRGLLAADHDTEQALALLSRAVSEHEALGDPFGTARALLALGRVRRRARQKRSAREATGRALDRFESLGASWWAQAARAELDRISGRRHVQGLTPAERRVADLVAEGKTNREVANILFLGERTVASHLTHIYAKLGVRSRTELARRLDANNSS